MGYTWITMLTVAVSSSIISAPLYGSIHSEAYYYANVFVGSPPQKQSVILDTGSSILAFPCTGCKDCGVHLYPAYDVSKSTTAKWLPCDDDMCFSNRCSTADGFKHCDYHQAYSEGSSIGGHYFSDIISLTAYGSSLENEDNSFNPGVTLLNQLSSRFDHIGCHTIETNLFVGQSANGILGVAFPKGTRQPTALDALFRSTTEKVDNRVLSLCLSDEGGSLTIGGIDDRLLDKKNAEPVYTKILSSTSYSIGGNGLSKGVAGEAETIVSTERFGSTIIDSGTTYCYMPPKIYGSLYTDLTTACSGIKGCKSGRSLPNLCYSTNVTDPLEELDRLFPNYIIKTNDGASLPWMPRSYFFSKKNGTWCVAIENNYSVETVLGMSFMKNQMISINRTERTLTTMKASCPVVETSQRLANSGPIYEEVKKQAEVSAIPGVTVDTSVREKPKEIAFANIDTSDRSYQYQNSFSSGSLTGSALGVSLGVMTLLCYVVYYKRKNSAYSSAGTELQQAQGGHSNAIELIEQNSQTIL